MVFGDLTALYVQIPPSSSAWIARSNIPTNYRLQGGVAPFVGSWIVSS